MRKYTKGVNLKKSAEETELKGYAERAGLKKSAKEIKRKGYPAGIRLIGLLLCMSCLTGCGKYPLYMDSYRQAQENQEKENRERGKEGNGEQSREKQEKEHNSESLWEADENLDFDEFIDELFIENASSDTMTLHFLLVEPEKAGITPGPVTLGGFGYEDKEENARAIERCRRQLAVYDRSLLTREQRITADILNEYLDSCERDMELEYYYEPFKSGVGIHVGIPYSLAEYKFYDEGDIEDYLALLTMLKDYFTEVLEWEEEKAEEGLFMCDELLDIVIDECQVYLWDGKEDFFLHETFVERLDELPQLTKMEKESYIEREKELLKTEFVAAYKYLIAGLEEMYGRGENDQGVCYFPEGTEYYEYLIDSNIGMTYGSVDELFDAVLDELGTAYDEMYEIMNYQEELADKWAKGASETRSPEKILEELQERTEEDFPKCPENRYQVRRVAESMEEFVSPAFYMIPPIDQYEENVIYINDGYLGEADYGRFTTLAHEGYPGHLYQSVYFASQERSNLRKMMDFSGYSEGWGTYAEYYSYRWLPDMEPALQQLYYAGDRVNMIISVLLDIGVNYYGWTREEAAEVCEELLGVDMKDEINDVYVYLINDPAGYLDYYVGYLEIRNMEQEARDTIGNDYEIKEFHQFLLDFGPAPFTVIRPYFEEWLREKSLDKIFEKLENGSIVA